MRSSTENHSNPSHYMQSHTVVLSLSLLTAFVFSLGAEEAAEVKLEKGLEKELERRN